MAKDTWTHGQQTHYFIILFYSNRSQFSTQVLSECSYFKNRSSNLFTAPLSQTGRWQSAADTKSHESLVEVHLGRRNRQLSRIQMLHFFLRVSSLNPCLQAWALSCKCNVLCLLQNSVTTKRACDDCPRRERRSRTQPRYGRLEEPAMKWLVSL